MASDWAFVGGNLPLTRTAEAVLRGHSMVALVKLKRVGLETL